MGARRRHQGVFRPYQPSVAHPKYPDGYKDAGQMAQMWFRIQATTVPHQ